MDEASLKKLYPLVQFLNVAWWIYLFKFIDPGLVPVAIFTLTALMGIGGLLFGRIRVLYSWYTHGYKEGTTAKIYGFILTVVSIFFIVVFSSANKMKGGDLGMVITVSILVSGVMVAINLISPD